VPATSADIPRTALVTGGAKGIGRAICHALAAAGDAIVVADLDLAAAEDCAGSIRAAGGEARAVALDVTDVEAVRAVVAEADRVSPLRAVVANAGIAFARPLVDVEPDAYDLTMGVNVKGVFFTVQAAARAMAPRGGGAIVTTCSTSGFTASTGPMTVYDASKGAVRLLTQAAARELAPLGIRVNAVAPGTVETELTLGLATAEQLAALGDTKIPLGRLGRPEEIAAAVVFLASDAASYVTGHVLAADGGWLA
jgi:NAD(P)-dependent dehydrogenase (short-subunit alcohol dehydrogenase family)